MFLFGNYAVSGVSGVILLVDWAGIYCCFNVTFAGVGQMHSASPSLALRSYSQEVASHSHDYHQLVLPVDGELCLSVEHSEGAVTAQQAAIIPAGADHGFYAPVANRFLVADVPTEMAPLLERLPVFVQLDAALSHYIQFLFQQLHGLDNRAAGSIEQQMLGLLLQLLQQRYQPGIQRKQDRRIELLQAYLDAYIDRPVTLPQMANVVHLSVRQLNALFQQQLGMSPQQYLLQLRMQRARQLLETTTLQVQAVADQVGYTNLAAFSDRFRRHFGQSPRYYRQSTKQHC